jgi:putative integral membrane protein (TIGR02587 family)
VSRLTWLLVRQAGSSTTSGFRLHGRIVEVETNMPASKPRPVRQSLREYGRGIAGGLVFSVPMLYTMEVWWRGFTADALTLLIYLTLSCVLLLGYNRYSGIHPSATWREVFVESIEEMGIGLLLSAGILFLLGRITSEMPLQEILGKTIVEAMTVAVGVSVGTAQLGAARSDEVHKEHEQQRDEQPPHAWGQVVLGFCGAILIASNVAPTEEIQAIAFSISAARQFSLVVLSIILCALILFFSEFVSAHRLVRRDAPLWIGYGIVSSYALALIASALMLWFFGRLQGEPWPAILAQVVVLGLPAALGASAGRLLIQ